MSSDRKTTKMVDEDTGFVRKEFKAKNFNAFFAKPRTSLLDKLHKKPNPYETDTKPFRDQKSSILQQKPKMTDKNLQKIETTATTVDVKINKCENILKTSKNYRKKASKIRSGTEDISLVKRIVDKNETNSSLSLGGLHSKKQELRKSRIKYTKLYELTEIPDRANIHTCQISSNVHKMLISPQRKSVDKPLLLKKYTLNNEIVEKSPVKPITPVDTSRSKLLI
jgi:hypothetical protein